MVKFALILACLLCTPASAFNPAKGSARTPTREATVTDKSARASVKMESQAELEALAKDLNPVVGYWDPLDLASGKWTFGWGPNVGPEEAIGFLRHAEIKHGRVAMAAFIGYIVQANGLHFPWKLTNDIAFADISAAGGPPQQWDALPTASKVQIFLFIAFLEWCSESTEILEASGMKHYMRGGKPGAFPSIKNAAPHPIPLDLFDPFGLQKGMSAEAKSKGLLTEINNGRLAMLGIMGFLAESKVPGSVPMLKGVVKPYAGEIMAPFSDVNSDLPFVAEMVKATAREQKDLLFNAIAAFGGVANPVQR
mmetsp:Transcript_130334/g.212235  ORF Transcript_130334/g.212235 Transcript_130334/m.212235 type:complete len:309 (+) Transcript_130334:86-1012(+)